MIPRFVAQQAELPRPKPHQSFGLLDPPYQGYTVQRAESLVGFFYLLTLYGLIRAAGKGIGDGGF